MPGRWEPRASIVHWDVFLTKTFEFRNGGGGFAQDKTLHSAISRLKRYFSFGWLGFLMPPSMLLALRGTTNHWWSQVTVSRWKLGIRYTITAHTMMDADQCNNIKNKSLQPFSMPSGSSAFQICNVATILTNSLNNYDNYCKHLPLRFSKLWFVQSFNLIKKPVPPSLAKKLSE